MEQEKALDALEPFLALTKSATSPIAAAELISQAISHPSTFLFAALLAAPPIQSLSHSDEHAPWLALLHIFSHGTCQTYREQRRPQRLPALSPAQALKLRQLSLLTLAGDQSNLTYDALIRELALTADDDDSGSSSDSGGGTAVAAAADDGVPVPPLDVRGLEDVVISAMYAGLIDGSLDPRRRCVRVSRVAPLRDLAPGAVPAMISALRGWSGRCTSALAHIEAEVAQIRAEAERRHNQKVAADALLQKMAEDNGSKACGGGSSGSSGGSGSTPSGGSLDHGHSQGHSGFAANHGRAMRSAGNGRGKRMMDGRVDEDEAMDVDEDDMEGEKKRAKSRRG